MSERANSVFEWLSALLLPECKDMCWPVGCAMPQLERGLARCVPQFYRA